jgi:16S rRNA (guanine1207-N2)-methyltransferase
MSHYYDSNQESELRFYDVRVNLLGQSFVIKGAPGVFSAKEVDKGTAVLIKYARIEPEWSVLDLGCGYGVVGITLKKANPSIQVTMADVNKRAVKLSKLNSEGLGIEVIHSEGFAKIDGRFDTILLNPPQSAGKEVWQRLITGAREHLAKGGLLQVVARHNKGGRALSAFMESVFGNVRDICKKSGYRVYVSEQR